MISSTAWPAPAYGVDVGAIGRDVADGHSTVPGRLDLARRLGRDTPPLTADSAAVVFTTLAAVAAADVTTARTVEPHLDALSILAQAGMPADRDDTWGVFAAEAPGTRLTARPDGGRDGGFLLDGRKPWCSLAGTLDRALVTAHVGDGTALFAVPLRGPGVEPVEDAWVARGFPEVPSGPVDFHDVAAEMVRDPGWYLRRPGFAWGGIGVAACWWGGAVGLGRRLRDAVQDRPGPLRHLALGSVVVALQDAEDALAGAAAAIAADAEPAAGWSFTAHTVRSRVRAAVDTVVATARATLGPGPLTAEPSTAARIADLDLYVLQDHGPVDLARIGELVSDDRRTVAW